MFKIVSLIAMTALLANCSKGNSGGSTVTTVGTYQMVNNICYQNLNGVMTQVAPNLCSNSGSYQMMNGVCYQLVNGQYVQQSNTALCSTSANSYQFLNGICYQVVNGQYIQQPNTTLCSSTSTTQLCNGYYTDGSRMALCTEGASGISYSGTTLVMDCSGYTLYNQQGQIVRCQ